MATWHVAASLIRLRDQLNAKAPKRSKVSDGYIGDAAHATRDSDHNPWYNNTVTAADFTNDPSGGMGCPWLATALINSRDRRIKYIIWNKRILSGAGGPSPWVWRAYSGINTHEHHLHISVVATPSCESTATWNLGVAAPSPTPTPSSTRVFSLTNPLMQGTDIRDFQAFLNKMFPSYSKLTADGVYGPASVAVVKIIQGRLGLTADGEVGPATRRALGL